MYLVQPGWLLVRDLSHDLEEFLLLPHCLDVLTDCDGAEMGHVELRREPIGDLVQVGEGGAHRNYLHLKGGCIALHKDQLGEQEFKDVASTCISD